MADPTDSYSMTAVPGVGHDRDVMTRPDWLHGGPRPSGRVLLVVSLWAAILTALGLVVAIAAGLAILAPHPGWYPAAVLGVGCAGTACSAVALAAVDHPRIRWAFLGCSSWALAAAAVMTSAV